MNYPKLKLNQVEQEKRYALLQEERLKRERRKFLAVKYSDNHGRKWRLIALCEKCFHSIEPPVRAIEIGETGVYFCDWCSAINDTFPKR